jgi:hypothetical protein
MPSTYTLPLAYKVSFRPIPNNVGNYIYYGFNIYVSIQKRENKCEYNISKHPLTYDIFTLLGYYAASCGNCLPTFRVNVSAPFSRVKSPSRKERKPAACNVDSGKCGGVAISRRDDSQ